MKTNNFKPVSLSMITSSLGFLLFIKTEQNVENEEFNLNYSIGETPFFNIP